MNTRLFLYGSLKRGFPNNRLLEGQRFLGEATTRPRYRLYDVGEYPALLPVTDGGIAIRGEVWEVDTTALVALDRYECLHKGLYTRQAIQLEGPFEATGVEAYLYLRSVEGLLDCGAEWK